ncbi:MAG: BrnA antitoxin family protein [Burkholderiaceae bacterium]
MSRKPKAEEADRDNPEWTTADFEGAKPLAALPESLREKLRGRGPQKSPTKERVTIRLSREVVEEFRATGVGWQTRMDLALKEWLKGRRAAAATAYTAEERSGPSARKR